MVGNVSARVFDESRKEEDLLSRSPRRVKRKTNEDNIVEEMLYDALLDSPEGQLSYIAKLFTNEGFVSFSLFNCRCFSQPNVEFPLCPISKEDKEKFLVILITDEEFDNWCKS